MSGTYRWPIIPGTLGFILCVLFGLPGAILAMVSVVWTLIIAAQGLRGPQAGMAEIGSTTTMSRRHRWLTVSCQAAVLFMSGTAISQAQALDQAFHQHLIDTWSIDEGLPQITILDIVQDPKGYIWVATQAGLARFDGVRFTNFDPTNTPELPGQFVQALYVDNRQRLWIGTYKGAAYYYNDTFRAIDDGSGREIDVYAFAESDDVLLAATDRGLLRLLDDSFFSQSGDPRAPLRSIHRHGEMLLAGGVGEIFVATTGQWQRHALEDDLSGATVNRFAYHDGRYWAATSRGLLFLDQDRWSRLPLPDSADNLVFETLFADHGKELWAGAAGWLIRVRDGKVIEQIPDDAPYSHGTVLSMATDHEGNLWLGSRWEGLARLWRSWALRYDRPEGLHNSLLWTVVPDAQGDVWTGTMDGLAVFRNGRFEQVTRGIDQPHPHAYSLLPEADRVWVGTRTGLFWWNRISGRIDKPESFSALDSSQINGIIRRQDGSYWLASFDGVWRWQDESLERMAAANEPGGTDVRIVHETSDGRLLAGTWHGLLQFDPRSERFLPMEGTASGQDITAIMELESGQLVVGTLDERLWIEREGGRWLEFGSEHGLPSSSPFTLAESDGVLWVAGMRGIYELPLAAIDDWDAGRIDRLPARMVINNHRDPVPGTQRLYCCNGAGNVRGFLHQGEFWLPTRQGLIRLILDHIERNPHPPQVVIDRIRHGGQWRALQADKALVLPSDERDVAFGFAVLSFQDPGSIKVEYRLVGFDESWQPLDQPVQRQIIYTNLPAGNLRLEVRASNNAGVWSEQMVLPFRIEPRFAETIMFQVLVFCAGAMLFWLGLNWRLHSLKRQRRGLEKAVAERTEALHAANENLRDYSRRMETASMTDPLTGLWNRRYLLNQLPADLAHFQRELGRNRDSGLTMPFMLVDIDHFKRINDVYGHAIGDEVLEQFGKLLPTLVQHGDYVVRWGGEEFLLVFRPVHTTRTARIADRLVSAVRQHAFEVGSGQTLALTCSIGIAEYPPCPTQTEAVSWEKTVALADMALYTVKKGDRDGWCLIQPKASMAPEELIRRLDGDPEGLLTTGDLLIQRDQTINAC